MNFKYTALVQLCEDLHFTNSLYMIDLHKTIFTSTFEPGEHGCRPVYMTLVIDIMDECAW